MKPIDFLLVLLVETCSIAGQIFFKHSSRAGLARPLYLKFLGLGILLKATDHFLWLGLQAKFPLSYIYPFDAINRVLLVAAAWFFLKERATPQTWLGMGLITAGVWLVSAS
jgi:uncharacterized membrane protein